MRKLDVEQSFCFNSTLPDCLRRSQLPYAGDVHRSL